MAEGPPKLYALLMKQDDQRKCSATKLCRWGLAKALYRIHHIPKRAVVLNPKAPAVFLFRDRAHLGYGLVAVDCSWKKAEEVFVRDFTGLNRRLPLLIPSNPVNYGQISMLSSVEALAAALYIAGYAKEGEKILSIFKWGPHFFTLNKGPLEDYRSAKSEEDVFEVEKEYFGR